MLRQLLGGLILLGVGFLGGTVYESSGLTPLYEPGMIVSSPCVEHGSHDAVVGESFVAYTMLDPEIGLPMGVASEEQLTELLNQ